MSPRTANLLLRTTTLACAIVCSAVALSPRSASAQSGGFASPLEAVIARWCVNQDSALFRTTAEMPPQASAGLADGTPIQDRCFMAGFDDDAWDSDLGFVPQGGTVQLDLFAVTNHVGSSFVSYSVRFDADGLDILDFQAQDIYSISALQYFDYAIDNPCTPFPDCFALAGSPPSSSNWTSFARKTVQDTDYLGDTVERFDTGSAGGDDGTGLLESQSGIAGFNYAYDSGLAFPGSGGFGVPRANVDQAELRIATIWFRVNDNVPSGTSVLAEPGFFNAGEAITNADFQSITNADPWQQALDWVPAVLTVDAAPNLIPLIALPEPASALSFFASLTAISWLARKRRR